MVVHARPRQTTSWSHWVSCLRVSDSKGVRAPDGKLFHERCECMGQETCNEMDVHRWSELFVHRRCRVRPAGESMERIAHRSVVEGAILRRPQWRSVGFLAKCASWGSSTHDSAVR